MDFINTGAWFLFCHKIYVSRLIQTGVCLSDYTVNYRVQINICILIG